MLPMSRQLLYVILLLLQFHACFASRLLGFFHKDELLRFKENETESHVKGLTTNCRMKAELCVEGMASINSIKGASEGDVETHKRTTYLGRDSNLEKQKEKRVTHQDVKMVEARTALESWEPMPGEDIEVKDYATPRRKAPIHNDRP